MIQTIVKMALLVFALLAMLAVCSPNTSSPEFQSDIVQETSTGQAKQIELILAHWGEINNVVHWGLAVPWKEQVEERTGGRVHITIYPAQSLAKASDLLPAVLNGISDISLGVVGDSPEHFPRTTVIELPFLGFSSAAMVNHVLQDLSHALLAPDYDDVHLLWLWSFGNAQLHTIKPVKLQSDLQGLKLRVTGKCTGDAMKLLGADPVLMPATDIHRALEKKVLDGTIFPWEAIYSFNIADVVKYHTVFNIQPAGPFYAVMNLEKWNSLPLDIQKVIAEVSGNNAVQFTIAASNKAEVQGLEISDAGHMIFEIPENELDKIRYQVMPTYEKWLMAKEKEGIDGQGLIDETTRLIKIYQD